jgi:hypothetical protein
MGAGAYLLKQDTRKGYMVTQSIVVEICIFYPLPLEGWVASKVEHFMTL